MWVMQWLASGIRTTAVFPFLWEYGPRERAVARSRGQ